MDEWEDIAYGSPASTSNDGWEDVAFGAQAAPPITLRQEIENQAPWYTKAASGAMAGYTGLADLLQGTANFMTGNRTQEIENAVGNQLIESGAITPEQFQAEKTKGLGDWLRTGLDAASGVEGSTEIGRGGLAHKVGEYLPGVAMGGGNIIGNGLKSTAGNIAKLLGLDAYLGTAGYVGNELGGTGGEIAATLGASTIPSLVKGSYRGAKNLLAPDLTAQADDVTKATLGQFTDVETLPERLSKIKTNEFTPYARTAEQIQDPGLALLTKSLEKNIPEANTIGLAKDLSRENLIAGIFNAALGGTISKEVAGKLVREGLQENKQALTKSIGTQYNKASVTKGTVPIQTVKMAVNDAMEAELKYGLGIDASTAKFVEKFKELPANAPLKTVNEFRKKAGSLIGDLRQNLSKSPEQNSSMNVLRTMFGGLDGAEKFAITEAAQGVTKAGIKKGISGAAAKALEKGRELTATRGNVFGKDAAGAILKQDQFKQFKLQDSKVLGKAISTPEDARQIITGLKGKTTNKAALQAGLMEELSLRGSDSKGVFTAARFSNNWKKISPVADEILTKTQIRAVDKVKNDLLSRANFDSIASNASKGQSITAQSTGTAALVKDVITEKAKSRSGIIGKLFGGIAEGRAEKVKSIVDRNLIEMAFDPKYAKAFLEKPSLKSVNNITNDLTRRLTAVGVANISQKEPQTVSEKNNKLSEKPQTQPSFNNTTDYISNKLAKAEDKMAMEAPKIIEVKRVSSKVPSDSFVEKEEGGQILKAYPPPAKGSGTTVATGIDLGQHSEKDLKDLGVSDKTIYKVRKYLGAKDATARKLLKEKPLTLTKAEADELDTAIHSDIYDTVESKLKSKGVILAKLPQEAQSVVKSLAINFGKNLDDKIPTIWKAITEKDWPKVQNLLVTTKWKQPELVARRKREADLLTTLV